MMCSSKKLNGKRKLIRFIILAIVNPFTLVCIGITLPFWICDSNHDGYITAALGEDFLLAVAFAIFGVIIGWAIGIVLTLSVMHYFEPDKPLPRFDPGGMIN